MTDPPVLLRALGWDHPRCTGPMEACSRMWEALRSHVRIELEIRSLEAFGDEPLDRVARKFDLLTIDHPLCGLAVSTDSLAPLEELIPRDELKRLGDDSIGPSFDSYRYQGSLWAVPVDGACQVSAVREDLLRGALPSTWTEVRELASERPGSVALPLAPAHAISSFLTYCTAHGAEPASTPERLVSPEVGLAAVEWLAVLATSGTPEALGWEPPDLLARMATADTIAYAPLTYGYVTYATSAEGKPIRFLDIPGNGSEPRGAVLGGVGLAVSRSSASADEAAAFAAWVADARTQREVVAPAGGQPSSRAAWLDDSTDAAANGFYSGTRATMENAWVRPRDPWWPPFQFEAGRVLTSALGRGASATQTLADLDSIYLRLRGQRSVTA